MTDVKLPRNCVSLGNGLIAQVELKRKSPQLNVSIRGNVVTWYIPRDCFSSGELEHIFFQINIFCLNGGCCLQLATVSETNLEKKVNFICKKGNNSFYSWGNEGGDFVLLNPQSKVSAAMSTTGGIIQLGVTTSQGSVKEMWRKMVCDGGEEPINFSTYGGSTQSFYNSEFDEDEKTRVYTRFNFASDDYEPQEKL